MIFSSFSSIPSKLFLSSSCSDVSTLQTFIFRVIFTSAIFIPVMIIMCTYGYFYIILSRRFRWELKSHKSTNYIFCSLTTITSAIQKQNIRAAGITLVILISCLLCWIPISVTHLLICPSGKFSKSIFFRIIIDASGCLYQDTDLDPTLLLTIHAIFNFLLISKSVINPIIFALRNGPVRRNLIRIIKCRGEREDVWRTRQKSMTKYSFVSSNDPAGTRGTL